MTTPTQDVRRRLLAGEPLTTAQVAEEYGTSRSLLSVILGDLKKEGAAYTKEPIGGNSHRFTITHPKPDPDMANTWGKSRDATGPTQGPLRHGTTRQAKPPRARTEEERARDRERKRKQRHPSAGELSPLPPRPAKRNGSALEHPVPTLGDSLSVFLLALDDDGHVRIGLRNGDATWLAKVDGYAPR